MAIARNYAQINRQTNEVVLIGDKSIGMPIPDNACVYTIEISAHAQRADIDVGWVYDVNTDKFAKPSTAVRIDPVQEVIATTATLENGDIKLILPYSIGTGTLVKFTAPCDCTEVTGGIVIDGSAYLVVDSNDKTVAGIPGAWVSGAHVAVIIDKEDGFAYIQGTAPLPNLIETSPLILVAGRDYGTEFPANPVKGQLFFKKV